MSRRYESLKLENQLCFPLYAVSNMITRKYRPLLEEIDLTYTQYIVMMVLWEKEQVNETCLCDALFLKSSTLTPLLKKLTAKGYITKSRDPRDERNLIITLSEEGKRLKEKALAVPKGISREFHLSEEEAQSLYRILYKMIDQERAAGKDQG